MSLTMHIMLLLLAFGGATRVVFFVKHVDGADTQLYSELERRSDPSSKDYLSWLKQEEVNRILQPDPTHLATIETLLRQHGAQMQSVGGGKIVADFAGPIPRALLTQAAHAVDAVDAVDAIDAVWANATRAFRRKRRSKTLCDKAGNGDDPQACLSDINGVTPGCIRKAYGLEGTAKGKTAGQAVIVNQGFLASDLTKFQQQNGLPSQSVIHTVAGNPGTAGDEASLDLEYIMATGSLIPTTYVYLDGKMENPFSNWLVWAANASDAELPKVHSLSLGAGEDQVGEDLMKRMNVEMAALGARGVTILFASGDSGYQPEQKFGAASPYVTAVGGVFNGLMRCDDLQADEISTGGFAASPQNKAGSWQAAAIAAYMKTSGQRPANIDPTQRAVPDLSAYDDEINIIQNGQAGSLSGTSAACPMVAGMLASINDALAAGGHATTLGFANPFLYANQAAFLDVTEGNNHGIAAVPGYDPISGLGTFSTTTLTTLTQAALKAAARAAELRRADQF